MNYKNDRLIYIREHPDRYLIYKELIDIILHADKRIRMEALKLYLTRAEPVYIDSILISNEEKVYILSNLKSVRVMRYKLKMNKYELDVFMDIVYKIYIKRLNVEDIDSAMAQNKYYFASLIMLSNYIHMGSKLTMNILSNTLLKSENKKKIIYMLNKLDISDYTISGNLLKHTRKINMLKNATGLAVNRRILDLTYTMSTIQQ